MIEDSDVVLMPKEFGTITHIAKKAVEYAKQKNKITAFEFNGIDCYARPTSDPSDVAELAMLKRQLVNRKNA
jgi:hypothetical protein